MIIEKTKREKMLSQHFLKSSFIPHTDIYMDASISRIVTHLLVYNHGKFHAFIKKCTIVTLNSPTTGLFQGFQGFPGLKKFSRVFQDFQGPYEPCVKYADELGIILN